MIAYVTEQERRSERRRRRSLRFDKPNRSRLNIVHEGEEGLHVVDILQALARSFGKQRKIPFAPSRLEELARTQTLLP